jgi:hypothetical protein
MTYQQRMTRLISLLGWSEQIGAVSTLITAVRGSNVGTLSDTAAVCFDANVYLNLGKGSKASELIDYFRSRHKGPLIMPNQVLLELWNNYLSAVETFTDKVQRQLEDFNKTIEEIEPHYSALREGAVELVRGFREEYGHVFNERTQTDLIALLDMLADIAIPSQVDRALFSHLAIQRKRSKTPPGFKDDGDGDFYVWAELLNGLLIAKESKKSFDKVILVTDDVKKDWSTNGSPHPLLVAEVETLVGVPFQVMRLVELKAAVKDALG